MHIKNTRIAVIGAGLIGREHMSLINNIDRYRLSGVVTPTEDSKKLTSACNVLHNEELDTLIEKPVTHTIGDHSH